MSTSLLHSKGVAMRFTNAVHKVHGPLDITPSSNGWEGTVHINGTKQQVITIAQEGRYVNYHVNTKLFQDWAVRGG